MTETKKARAKAHPKSDGVADVRKEIVEAERALAGVGHEKVVVDAEGYKLTAALIAKHRIPKSFVLRKALIAGLKVLMEFGEEPKDERPPMKIPSSEDFGVTNRLQEAQANGQMSIAPEETPDRDAFGYSFELAGLRSMGSENIRKALEHGGDPIAAAIASGEE